MDLHKRKGRRQGQVDALQQPLLSDEQATSSGRVERSSAVVPYSVNRVDWEALWSALATACRAGWNGVLDTLASCFSAFFSGQHRRQIQLTSVQAARLRELQERITEPYDADSPTHVEALRRLWCLTFPGVPWTAVRNKKWVDMGWQRDDPGSDFRGAGFVALENLLYLAEHHPDLYHKLLHKTEGDRSEWEYPFAVAGVNLTFMLEEILDLRRQQTSAIGHTPSTPAGRSFLGLLEGHSHAFEEIYCISFQTLDRVWLDLRASYMDFPAVIQRARSQIHAAISSNPGSLEGLKDLLPS